MNSCQLCEKGVRTIAFSRHKKGHGIAGVWRLKAPITKRTIRPNIHMYMGMKLCSKCLKTIKKAAPKSVKPTVPVAA